MKRQIVKIDEEKCNGCGQCVPNCHEGALQIIDGKVRLVSDLMCDGLGACLGHCPEDAITIEEREAEPYNEISVIKDIIPKGKNVLVAHLQHLKEHGESQYLKEAITYLEENRGKLDFDLNEVKHKVHHGIKNEAHEQGTACGCPGAKTLSFAKVTKTDNLGVTAEAPSELRQWPIQLHLVNPVAPYYRGADLVLAADCVGYAMGSFHQKYLKGKAIAIACPKLDSNTEIYIEKLRRIVDEANVNTITVMIMEVPCCGGLLQMVKAAMSKVTRKVPVKAIVVSIQGEVISENWI